VAVTGKYTVNEVEERTGVPAATLRQWERRYGFPMPERSASGYRLYGDDDLRHIRAMKATSTTACPPRAPPRWCGRGGRRPRAAAAAASCATSWSRRSSSSTRAAPTASSARRTRCTRSRTSSSTSSAARCSTSARLWHDGEINTTTEHFASSYVQGRLRQLMSLAGGQPHGQRVIVACAPHDQHEIGAMMLAVMLRRSGYQVYYVGANTPVADLAAMARDRAALRGDGLGLVARLRPPARRTSAPTSRASRPVVASAATASTRTRAAPSSSAASTSAPTSPSRLKRCADLLGSSRRRRVRA
jgi:MerR family transcriptional regulator, light-induced transcriptional regulator